MKEEGKKMNELKCKKKVSLVAWTTTVDLVKSVSKQVRRSRLRDKRCVCLCVCSVPAILSGEKKALFLISLGGEKAELKGKVSGILLLELT